MNVPLTSLATVIHLALPPLSILAMGRLMPRRGLAWAVVAGLALYESVLLSVGFILGYLGLLQAPVPLVCFGLVAIVLLGLAASGAGSALKAARASILAVHPRIQDGFLGLTVLATAYLIGLQVGRDWTVGTVSFDSLTYHIPRALQWSWHGNFNPYHTGVWHRVGLPLGGDVVLLPGIFLGIGWLGGCWTTVWLSLGAAAAVFAATRDLGVARRPSLLAALVFLSFPAVGMRLVDVNSDIAAAFPLLSAWVLATRARSPAEATFLFPALCGIGVACKGNVTSLVVVLGVTLFGSRLRTLVADVRALAAAAMGILFAVLFCLGSYLPARWLFGDFLGGNEGRIYVSYLRGAQGVERAALFGALHWIVEPFALVPEPPRFELLDGLGIGRAYGALGVGTRNGWYPKINAESNRSGVFPLLALPWLLAALPKGRRLLAGVFFLALVMAVYAPLNANAAGSRFAVVPLAAFAVLWGARAARSPKLVGLLLIASLAVEAHHIRWRERPHVSNSPEQNARIAAAVGSHTLWLLTGSLASDAPLAGRRANVRFEYLACPPDGDWVGHFASAGRQSPWLLLNINAPQVATGIWMPSSLGSPCPAVAVGDLQHALTAAGWRPLFAEYGYQLWTAEPAQSPD